MGLAQGAWLGPSLQPPELFKRFRVPVHKSGGEASSPHRVLMSLSHPPHSDSPDAVEPIPSLPGQARYESSPHSHCCALCLGRLPALCFLLWRSSSIRQSRKVHPRREWRESCRECAWNHTGKVSVLRGTAPGSGSVPEHSQAVGWAHREAGSDKSFQQQPQNLCKDVGSAPALDPTGLAAPFCICCHISRALGRAAVMGKRAGSAPGTPR